MCIFLLGAYQAKPSAKLLNYLKRKMLLPFNVKSLNKKKKFLLIFLVLMLDQLQLKSEFNSHWVPQNFRPCATSGLCLENHHIFGVVQCLVLKSRLIGQN